MRVEITLIFPVTPTEVLITPSGLRFADLMEPPAPPAPPRVMALPPGLRLSGHKELPGSPQVVIPLPDVRFANLMEPPPLLTERPDLAEPFEAFGMFGRRPDVVTGGERLDVIEAAAASSLEPEMVTPAWHLPHTAIIPHNRQQVVVEATAVTRPAGPAAAASRTRSSSMTSPSADSPVSMMPSDVEPEPSSATPARRQRALPAPNSLPRDQVTLLTLNPDSAQVAVRAAGVSQAEVQQFRARARDLFRDHGLILNKLSVNGEDRTGSASSGRKIQSWR